MAQSAQNNETAESRLETLQKDAAALNLIEFWKLRMDIELPQPRNRAVPFLWKWKDIEPRLLAASQIVPIEDCERRALLLSNPGLGGKPYATDTLLGLLDREQDGEAAGMKITSVRTRVFR